MSSPKMGNNYPGAISSYPTWVAHETPYTAEWGDSVGYEFYSIEYELGVNVRKGYNSLALRLDQIETDVGVKVLEFTVPLVTSCKGAGQEAVDELGAEVDASGDCGHGYFTLRSTRGGGWEIRVYGVSKAVEADGMMLQVKLKGGGLGTTYDARVDMDVTKASETKDIAINDSIEWKFTFDDYTGLNNMQECRALYISVHHTAASGDDCATNAYIGPVEIYNAGGIS